jgi:hypothetical protein
VREAASGQVDLGTGDRHADREEVVVMGRTTQTMTQLVAQEEMYWAPFRRALRKEDQVIFDRLFAAARHHTAPAHFASHSTPFDSILLAMLLEAMKTVETLRLRVEALEHPRG